MSYNKPRPANTIILGINTKEHKSHNGKEQLWLTFELREAYLMKWQSIFILWKESLWHKTITPCIATEYCQSKLPIIHMDNDSITAGHGKAADNCIWKCLA
jgi:hypothetical protein